MAILLALLAAAGWGSSDYAAGVASRRSSALSVVVLTHLVATVILTVVVAEPGLLSQLGLAVDYLHDGADGRAKLTLDVLLPARGPRLPGLADLLWGAAGGVSGGVGAVLLFRGLARGAVNVVAPITAVVAAVLPVAAGLLLGEALGAVGAIAVAMALIAVMMISEPASAPARHARHSRRGDRGAGIAPVRRRRRPAHARRRRDRAGRGPARPAGRRRLAQPGLPEALGSGLGFGGFYLLVGQTGDDAGLWPMLAARGASVVLFASVALLARERMLPGRADRRAVIAAGVLDAFAAALFLAATRQGLLSVVAVLSSLYPAATIALARVFDHERCSRSQLAGLGLAAVSVGVLAVT